MVIRQVLLRGLTARSLEEILVPSTGFKLLVLAAVGFVALYLVPKIPHRFGRFIDKISPVKISKEAKKQFSNILRWTVYILILYFALYILGFELIHLNPVFRILLVLYAVKVTIAILKPSVMKLDSRITGTGVSEGSILMKLMVSIIYIIGLLAVLSIIGLRGVLAASLAGAGVLGIVIGFGAKDIVSNTLSGIFIALDKPFKIDDIIEIKDNIGRVKEIGLRTTVIETFDREIVTVPNTTLVNNPIINYTANEVRRIKVEVGIHYDSDIKKAMEAFQNALESIESRADDREPEVIIKGFGGSSIDLEGRVWIKQHETSWAKSRSQIRESVVKEFREKEVSIPFPTRVIIKK